MVELTALRKEVGEMRSIEQELKEARSELMLARLSLNNAAAKLGKSGGGAGHRRRNLLHAEETMEGDRGRRGDLGRVTSRVRLDEMEHVGNIQVEYSSRVTFNLDATTKTMRPASSSHPPASSSTQPL